MGISWSDAVRDADNSDDRQRYRRAVSQANDLEPLIISFAEAVQRKYWPRTTPWSPYVFGAPSEETSLYTASSFHRHVEIEPPGEQPRYWKINLGRERPDQMDSGSLMLKPFHGEPHFGYESEEELLAAHDSRVRMDEMERTKDWVPRQLVACLRIRNIPIPD